MFQVNCRGRHKKKRGTDGILTIMPQYRTLSPKTSKRDLWVQNPEDNIITILPSKYVPGTRSLGQHCAQWKDGETETLVEEILQILKLEFKLRIYTDGAVQNGKSGWGIVVVVDGKVIFTFKESGGCNEVNSSLDAEAEAMTIALEWMAENADKVKSCAVILTDSMIIVRHRIEEGLVHVGWLPALEELHQKGVQIHFMYIPARSGVAHNLRADKLARDACKSKKPQP